MSTGRCLLIATGGTIASRIDPTTGLAEPVCGAEDLLASLPLAARVCDIELQTLATVPSPHIGPSEWIALHKAAQSGLERSDIAAVLISHGTATLEETAWFLDLTLATDKPVVVFGAQRNASEFDTDGPRNLASAMRIGIAPAARSHGVLVAMNQHINAAREATKTHSFDVETFQSGEWGYLGNVAPEKVIFHRAPVRRLHVPLISSILPRVDIVPMYAGADGALVSAAAAAGAKGIVVQAVGAGHVNPAVYDAVRSAIAAGVSVVVATRIPNGGTRPCYGFTGSAQQLQDAGAILSGDLSAWKARILLMLALQKGGAGIAELFRA
jgi:L-asparaginase